MDSNADRGMTETNVTNPVQNEIDSLKDAFNKLRTDVSELFTHAFGAGRHGASMARDYGMDTVEGVKQRFSDLRDRGAEQMHAFEHRVEEQPLKSAMIAFGAGFVMALLMRHRD
jgi:ElaB/YqjD/DUF883 family membrane-anchored ribosome-binding protein